MRQQRIQVHVTLGPLRHSYLSTEQLFSSRRGRNFKKIEDLVDFYFKVWICKHTQGILIRLSMTCKHYLITYWGIRRQALCSRMHVIKARIRLQIVVLCISYYIPLSETNANSIYYCDCLYYRSVFVFTTLTDDLFIFKFKCNFNTTVFVFTTLLSLSLLPFNFQF